MKKYLVLLGAAVLVMAVATPSMAQFKSWGHMEIATQWISKQDFNNGSGTAATTDDNRDLNQKWIAERFRYYLQYGDPKTVRAVIGFEADSNNWGEDRYRFSDGSAATSETNPSGRMGTYGADQVQLEIKHAFIEFVIPQTPLTVTAGIQFYGFGGRLWQSKDAPGVTATANFAPHQVQAFWWRERDNAVTGRPAYSNYEVNDTYGLAWAMTQQLFNVGAFGAYKNDQDAVTHPTYVDNPWWVGLTGGFRPGNWAFTANFIYNGGKRDLLAGTDLDYKGWLIDAMAKYKIGPGLAVAVEGYYASGHDADKTDEFGEYTYPAGSEATYGFGNDRFVFMFMNSDFMYYAGKQLYASGMWYGRANVEYNPTPWVNLNFNYVYLADLSKGTPGAGKVVNGISSAATYRQDKNVDYIGSEINAIAKIKIYEGFYYNIGLGYFIPGDAYDSSSKSADSAYSVLTCLRYFF
jgi:hypothetical protein